jgi:hypothetical protein
MATPQEKLAESLEKLHELQQHGVVAIRARDLTRAHRERLTRSGFLKEVMKGWYIPARTDESVGDTTAWFASFWEFCAAYLRVRFRSDWSLSPEQSLLLHAGNQTVPFQLVVRSPKARNRATVLLHETSILEVRASLPEGRELLEKHGLNLFSLPSALVASSPAVFAANPIDARTALSTIGDASEILERLLSGGQSVVAGRLAAAFRNIGRERIADEIVKAMRSAGYTIHEQDPFTDRIDLALPPRTPSPYAGRIRLMWHTMRSAIIEEFPPAPSTTTDVDGYLERVKEVYVTDAYHSLSIEGYRVSAELIERVRSGAWRPDRDEKDRELDNGLAARGYWLAFQAVTKSVKRVLAKENAGEVAQADHGDWYREMFAPRVTAGILPASSLAGYRNNPVYIRGSMHVPLPYDAVRDAMPVLFEMLKEESDCAVRVVLGHFVLVYVHPYMDGNGRIGRFLMNLMLASGGYPWTVLPVEKRGPYMAALEDASVRQNIVPLAKLLGQLVREGMQGTPSAMVPLH